MSEAWNELQALKSKQLSLREKIAARKELIAKTKNITSSTIETPKPVVPKETPAPSAVQEEPQLTTQVVKLPDIQDETKTPVIVSNCDDKAVIAEKKVKEEKEVEVGKKRPSNEEVVVETKPVKVPKKSEALKSNTSLEDLLSMQSAMDKEGNKSLEEIYQLLKTPTALESKRNEKFMSKGGRRVREYCRHGTRSDCSKYNVTCDKLHFRKIIHQHTDESLGDCSFLNTCFHMETCKYVHYQIDYSSSSDSISTIVSSNPPTTNTSAKKADSTKVEKPKNNSFQSVLYPPQWIQCDLRNFNMAILGKFSVVMADPPWDIHMELPYGTMSDEEMRKLNVPVLQDDGYIFLWVTGRAMELGRECLTLWGYERVDEVIWVKTNQLQRIIRTGRTGHWLNHGKEHCLVGVKGNPKVNKGIDCDVIVSEVRATSHKPDEIYGIIERLSPGTRKLELFGRPHNTEDNWITLGNQLDGVKLLDPDVVKAFKMAYPSGSAI